VSSKPREAPAAESSGWLSRLGEGLGRSASKLADGIGNLLAKRRLDAEALQSLEDLLIESDLGPATSAKLVAALGREKFGAEVSAREVREALARGIAAILEPVARPLAIDKTLKPHVVLVVGVNGTGKTTTIGKLAQFYRDQGLRVTMAAGDTFRAAAIEQLQIWGARTGAKVIAAEAGTDAAALAFDAFAEAQKDQADLLLIDTAGRLHNKADLMAELQKIARVLKKIDQRAPHSVLLVLDATTGQNAQAQVQTFQEMVRVTGLIVTKLDGSARGGILVALAERFALPVHAVGVGEGAEDLRPFEAQAFARALLGLD
jgi:fused signal recognition particle receptor